MIIYIVIHALKIINMTKQSHMKQAIYVNGSDVWLEEISNFLLN